VKVILAAHVIFGLNCVETANAREAIMRYTEECKQPRKYFGFYSRLYEDLGETKTFDKAYDLALEGSGRRAISNRDFLKVLIDHFIKTPPVKGV
jgi:hypothetical protein